MSNTDNTTYLGNILKLITAIIAIVMFIGSLVIAYSSLEKRISLLEAEMRHKLNSTQLFNELKTLQRDITLIKQQLITIEKDQ